MKYNKLGYKIIEPQDLIDYRIFNDNLELLTAQLVTNEENFVSIDNNINQLLDKIETIKKDVEDNKETIEENKELISQAGENIQSHIDDKDNPHEITLELLNGASIDDIESLQAQIDTINKYFGGILEKEF